MPGELSDFQESGMPMSYQIIFWRDIPMQVKLRGAERGERMSRMLSDRFQLAIDEAAMQAGKSSSDDYLAEWVTGDWQERQGTLESVAEAVTQELELAYPTERLQSLARHGGRLAAAD